MTKRAPTRLLRLLRIDDDITTGGNPKTPGFQAQRAPRHLETVELQDGARTKPGIGSWEDAVAFWTHQKGIPDIDLVISDVRFDDDTSPLVNGWILPKGAWLPTGLSHFKAFAALARFTGRPLGVGLHTKESRIWRRLTEEADPFLRVMGNLAAHEIGELAALLGEGSEIKADADSCWDWLEQRTLHQTEFREAVPRALVNYRLKLGAFSLLPADYEAMVQWCGRMEAKAAKDGLSAKIDDGTDEGFPVFFPDGSRHRLSIRSLFADVLLARPRYQFEREGLPKEAFELREDKDFHKLDQKGNPKIGALVYRCGQYGRAFKKALQLLALFPPPAGRNAPFTFADARAMVAADWPSSALAVLFQDVKRDFEVYDVWRRFYLEHEWNPITDTFGERSRASVGTLHYWVGRVAAAADHHKSINHESVMELFELSGYERDEPDAEMDFRDADDDVYDDVLLPDEIVKEDPGDCTAPARRRGWPGTRRCIGLLNDLGVLAYASGTKRYVITDTAYSPHLIPPAPRWLPVGFMEMSQLGPTVGTINDRLLKPDASLKKSFGYVRDGDNNEMLERAVCNGFGLEDYVEGREYIKLFRAGTPPVAWIKEAARDFARHEGWPEEGWPESLRDPPANSD